MSNGRNQFKVYLWFPSQADVAALRWGYKKGRELISRLRYFRGALPPAHPQFKEGSPAALTQTAPVPIDAPKIQYSAEDDAAIDANLRYMGELTTAFSWINANLRLKSTLPGMPSVSIRLTAAVLTHCSFYSWEPPP